MPSALENLCGANRPLKAEPADAEEFADLVEAADRLPAWDVDGWLDRFSPEASTTTLERVLRRQVTGD